MSSQLPPVGTLQSLVGGYKDPHGLYDTLRASERVAYDPAGRCWLVTGHEAVRSLLADERFVSDVSLAVPQRPARRTFLADAVQRQFIFMDGPRQTRAQRAVLVELSRRSDELLEPLRAAAYALAGRARERGEMDLLRDFAIPYSMEAISLILGFPVADAAQTERLERWSSTYANVTSGYLDVELDDIVRLGEYVRAQVRLRGGVPSDDLIGAFMRDGGFEEPEDVVINTMMAFAAGRVTTQKLLGDGLPLLLPEWAGWRDAVAASPTAARRLGDELLRMVTPTRYLVRFATAEATVAPGATIRRGDKVVLFLQAANRDPEAFAAPHELEGGRNPNPHVAFGFGPHRCPGASIARIEVQTALQALLGTLTELRPHPTLAPTWEPNPNIGGYATFPCLVA